MYTSEPSMTLAPMNHMLGMKLGGDLLHPHTRLRVQRAHFATFDPKLYTPTNVHLVMYSLSAPITPHNTLFPTTLIPPPMYTLPRLQQPDPEPYPDVPPLTLEESASDYETSSVYSEVNVCLSLQTQTPCSSPSITHGTIVGETTPTCDTSTNRTHSPSTGSRTKRYPSCQYKHACPWPSCSKRFLTKCECRLHHRIHTNERPFRCPYPGCDKSFTRSNCLRRHRRLHTKEYSFTCTYCNKTFSERSLLIRHERSHTGEKPYRCSCGRRFAGSDLLIRHKRAHGNKRPYRCTFDGCSSDFKYPSGLHRHVKVHHEK